LLQMAKKHQKLTAQYFVTWTCNKCSLLYPGQTVYYKFVAGKLYFSTDEMAGWQASRYDRIPVHRILDGAITRLNAPALASVQI